MYLAVRPQTIAAIEPRCCYKLCSRRTLSFSMAPKAGVKRAAEGYSEGQLKSQCVAYFKGVAEKKKATNEEKDQAKTALSIYNQIGAEEKADFAKAFFNNKGTKNSMLEKSDARESVDARDMHGSVGPLSFSWRGLPRREHHQPPTDLSTEKTESVARMLGLCFKK